MKNFIFIITCLLSLNLFAETYNCPPANEINCVPRYQQFGSWNHNGSITSRNQHTIPRDDNNMVINAVYNLQNGKLRLFCHYTKCGNFYLDVEENQCSQISSSKFECN